MEQCVQRAVKLQKLYNHNHLARIQCACAGIRNAFPYWIEPPAQVVWKITQG